MIQKDSGLEYSPSLAEKVPASDFMRFTAGLSAPSVVLTTYSRTGAFKPVTLLGRGGDDFHNVASIFKLVAGVVVEDSIIAGKISLEDEISIQVEDLPSGILRKGDKFKLRELMALMLMRSNGAAALALGRHVGTHAGGIARPDIAQDWFRSRMQDKVINFGLSNTRVGNIPGNIRDVSQQYSTGYEIAKIGQYIALEYPLVSQFAGVSSRELFLPIHDDVQTINHTCKKVLDFPRGHVFAKSGTMLTNSILAVATIGDTSFSMVSLGSKVRTAKRMKDVSAMKRIVQRLLKAD